MKLIADPNTYLNKYSIDVGDEEVTVVPFFEANDDKQQKRQKLNRSRSDILNAINQDVIFKKYSNKIELVTPRMIFQFLFFFGVDQIPRRCHPSEDTKILLEYYGNYQLDSLLLIHREMDNLFM